MIIEDKVLKVNSGIWFFFSSIYKLSYFARFEKPKKTLYGITSNLRWMTFFIIAGFVPVVVCAQQWDGGIYVRSVEPQSQEQKKEDAQSEFTNNQYNKDRNDQQQSSRFEIPVTTQKQFNTLPLSENTGTGSEQDDQLQRWEGQKFYNQERVKQEYSGDKKKKNPQQIFGRDGKVFNSTPVEEYDFDRRENFYNSNK